MSLPNKITIVEVGARDGFQMEPVFIPTDKKVEIINAISQTGVPIVETTSFVNPKVIPQMADAAEVMNRIERAPGVRYTALIPNLKGADRALEAGVDGLRLVVCVSETYNQKNVGMSVEQSLEACEDVLKRANQNNSSVDVAVGLSFGCPLEGHVPPKNVFSLVGRLVDMGFQEIAIADTVGVANPQQVREMMGQLLAQFPGTLFSLHFHDTRGLGLANVLAGIEEGVTQFDSSIGGMGGCPVVPGASGNIATEDLVNMLNEMGLETGVDTDKVMACSSIAERFFDRRLPSHILQAGTRAQLYQKSNSNPN
ncbi:MAG: hydroxymethylglutaryl-CoA lyase [Acidobacteriota bacterium]